MKNKMRNVELYWVDPDGFIVREWNKIEYDTLSPTDKITIEMYELCCPGCGKHKYYTMDEKVGLEMHFYCASCIKKKRNGIIFPNPNKGYQTKNVAMNCLKKYEYFDEQSGMWHPKIKLIK